MPKHRKPEFERFRGPAKWVQYVFARGLVTLLQHLPVPVAYRLGRGVGWLCWKCMSKRRVVVRKNLEVVNTWMEARASEIGDGEAGAPPTAYRPPSTDTQVREVFLRAGANLFSGFPFARMTADAVGRYVEVEGAEHLKAALGEGRGVIILLAHMGPWELLAHLHGLLRKHGIDAPHGALFRPLNNAYLDDWYKAQRERQGTRLFSRRDGFNSPVAFLRRGGIVGVLADQRAGRGEAVRFFGQTSKVTPLPGLLQRRTGAGVVAATLRTLRPAFWRISFAPVDIAPGDGGAEEGRTAFAKGCARALEISLSTGRLDVFWLHDRFKRNLTREEKMRLKQKGEQ